MKFPFKNSDMVRCKILRPIVFNKADQVIGAVVECTGWQAKQLMGSVNPSLELVKGVKPTPIVERDTEVVISTPDPVVKATTAAAKTASKPRKAKKPMFNLEDV
jgi:hypothetical protein